MKAVLAVLALLELVKDSVGEGPEALHAPKQGRTHCKLDILERLSVIFQTEYLHKALWVEELPVGVDYLCRGLEGVLAADAVHAAVHLDIPAKRVGKEEGKL